MEADAVLKEWHSRTGEYSPGYYAHYGSNETSDAIRRRFTSHLEPDAPILELGCSSGRHLAHLLEHGYRDLSGIDINQEMDEVMRESYPDLAETGQFFADAIENVITGFDDGQFQAVYSVETLQHIHHDNEWVFEEIARITDDILITVEIETNEEPSTGVDRSVTFVNDDFPLYYRDWGSVFGEFDLVEIESTEFGRDILRVFQADGN